MIGNWIHNTWMTHCTMSLDNDYLYKEYANLIKQGEGFEHAINIERSTGSIDDIIAWCKTNFADGWRWQIIRSSSPTKPGSYTFFFNNNADYMAFVLKYG